jgi:hypothetical protein
MAMPQQIQAIHRTQRTPSPRHRTRAVTPQNPQPQQSLAGTARRRSPNPPEKPKAHEPLTSIDGGELVAGW